MHWSFFPIICPSTCCLIAFYAVFCRDGNVFSIISLSRDKSICNKCLGIYTFHISYAQLEISVLSCIIFQAETYGRPLLLTFLRIIYVLGNWLYLFCQLATVSTSQLAWYTSMREIYVNTVVQNMYGVLLFFYGTNTSTCSQIFTYMVLLCSETLYSSVEYEKIHVVCRSRIKKLCESLNISIQC
jgi:hypothetical protein